MMTNDVTTPSELDPLNQMLTDKFLTDLVFNGHQLAFAEREGKLQRVASPFKTDADFERVLAVLLTLPNTVKTGRLQIDGMLPDGSRFHVTRPPQSPEYATLSIRKFLPMNRALESLVAAGTLSKKGAQFLLACVRG